MSVVKNNKLAKVVDSETQKCLVQLFVAFIKEFENEFVTEEEYSSSSYKKALSEGLLVSAKKHYKHLTENVEYHFKNMILIAKNGGLTQVDENKFFIAMADSQPGYFATTFIEDILSDDNLKDEKLSFVKFRNEWGIQIETECLEDDVLEILRAISIKVNKVSVNKQLALNEMIVSFSHQYIFDDDFIKGVVKSNFDINQMFTLKHS